jgi:WD40 repeat protein
MAVSPDNRFILTGGEDGTARLLEIATGNEVRRFEGYTNDRIRSVAISRDGRLLAVGGSDNMSAVWDLSSGRLSRRMDGSSDGINSVASRPDEHLLLTAGTNETARLWDMSTGREIRRLTGDTGAIGQTALSPDGRRALTVDVKGKGVLLWDVETGAVLRRLDHTRDAFSLAFSKDGQSAIVGGFDGGAYLWNLATGQEVRSFSSGEFASAVALSPDGRQALTGTLLGQLHVLSLWDVASGRLVRRMEGHLDLIESATFSADGQRALTASLDGTARLWDLGSGKELVTFRGNQAFVTAAVFSPDERFVITGSWDHTVRLWDASTGRWVATLVSFMNGGWAVVDPEGRYDASDPNDTPGLHWVLGLESIELRQLKQRFYTPGLLGRIVRRERLPEVAGLDRLRPPPELAISLPPAGARTAHVRITNRGGGIGEILVKVNGRDLPTATRGARVNSEAANAELAIDLAGATLVPNGENVIEVYGQTADGILRSRGLVTAWNSGVAPHTAPPRLFAIVVGTSDYENPALALKYPSKDAQDMARALQIAGEGLFGRDRTRVVVVASGTSQEPTKANIRNAFDDVAREASASDVMVLYLAGHGVASRRGGDQYYYLTREARSLELDRDSVLLQAHSVSSSELREWLGRQNMPLKLVLMLDTCAAGAALGETIKLAERRDLTPDQIRAVELLKDSTGSWILMGSAADAVSYEATRYGQGVLTYALLQGMRGAALESGGRVEVGRLFTFVQQQTEELARGIGGLQRPLISAPRGQTFPIGLVTESARAQIPLATVKPLLLRVVAFDENLLDPLNLGQAIRAELRAISQPTSRGASWTEATLSYLDNVIEDVPDAIAPRVQYRRDGDTIRMRLLLNRENRTLAERSIDVQGSDIKDLAKRVALAFTDMIPK